MSHGIGGISVRVIGKPIEMTEEQKRALEDVTFEKTGSLAEFYGLKQEVETCLIIDYVDLLPTPGRNAAKVDCGEIVKRVRELAKKHNITFKDLIGR